VSDLLKRGLRFGLIGTSDTRLSTPGNPRSFTLRVDDHPWPGGLTAVLAKELTRTAVLEALRERRCYATTGKRYLLEFTVDGKQMGSEIRVPRGHVAEIHAALGAVEKWLRLEVVGPDGPVASLSPEGSDADVVQLDAKSPPVNEPTFLYLRGMEETGGMAWSSPVFLIPE
jgi:hypothetical protein